MTGMTKTACATALAAAFAFTLSSCGGSGGGGDDSSSRVRLGLDVKVLSSRPDMVSGGNALVRVDTPTGAVERLIEIKANGRDVTSAFRRDPAGGGLLGVVTDLRVGDNTIDVSYEGVGGKSITVKNHPITGPMFSGPHEQPFVCETTNFTLPDGSRLPVAQDANCSVSTVVQYVYRTTAATAPAFRPLTDRARLPSDVANTTTNDGKTVPYVVRVETGTVNRAIYQIAMLHDPSKEAELNFTSASAGWNKRLVYTFGGGCTGGWYRQGASTGGVLDDNILKQGYAMASASLNVFGNNCQDVTAAETMAMVKERFIEGYGAPRYTIGWGCSGGSYQQHQIADNYPGLLDGILPGCSFPEVMFATVYSITDARLLGNYFRNTAPNTFSDEQQRAVAGFLNLATMYTETVYEGALRISPTRYCPTTGTPPQQLLSEGQRYNAQSNPRGAR